MSLKPLFISISLILLCSCNGHESQIIDEGATQSLQTKIEPIQVNFKSDLSGESTLEFTHGFVKFFSKGSYLVDDVLEEDSYVVMFSTFEIGCGFDVETETETIESSTLSFKVSSNSLHNSEIKYNFRAVWLNELTLISFADGATEGDMEISMEQLSHENFEGQFSVVSAFSSDFGTSSMSSSGSFKITNCDQKP